MEENAQWRLVHKHKYFPLLTHRREQWPPGTAAPARTSSSSKTVPGSRSYFRRGSLSSAFFFLSLTHSLSFSHSLSLSLSRWFDSRRTVGRATHRSITRVYSFQPPLVPSNPEGGGALSLFLSFRASEAEDRGRVSFLKDAELEGVGYPFTDWPRPATRRALYFHHHVPHVRRTPLSSIVQRSCADRRLPACNGVAPSLLWNTPLLSVSLNHSTRLILK